MKQTFPRFTFSVYFGCKSSGFFRGRMCPDFKVRQRVAVPPLTPPCRLGIEMGGGCFFTLNLDFCVMEIRGRLHRAGQRCSSRHGGFGALYRCFIAWQRKARGGRSSEVLSAAFDISST